MARLGAHGVKGIQRQNKKIWKVIWETMKSIHIVEEYKDQEDDEIETFHTPLDCPSQLVDENELVWTLCTQNISLVTNVTKSHVTFNIYSMTLHVTTT
jgi:hypothetical protein